MLKKLVKEYPLLLVIMVTALIIRLVAGYVQSFSNDELSALYRLQFNNFHDLIYWGVRVDGHPALVQLFLYAYQPLVGKSELLIRLPFILASTLSLGYIFFSLKKLSGEFTAYMVVIILAFAGFSIQLGYFARPYALGILFTSMATYYWIKIFIEQEKEKKIWFIFVLVAILACYTHYFVLLQMGVLGAATFIFSPIKQWWKMIVTGLIVMIAYIPNYNILMFQLSVGGIGGWLGKPKNYFLVDLVLTYFDRNPAIIGCFVLFPMLLMIIQSSKPVLKRISLYLFLSLIPFCLLYFYSIKINSLLQPSACFFFMPFLLAAFFSLFESGQESPTIVKWGYITSMVIFWGSVLIFNSAFTPIHYAEFKRIAKYIDEHESDSVTTVVAVNNPFYIDWYLKDKKPDLYVTDMGDDLRFLRRFIDTCDTKDFIYAFTNQRSNGEIPFILSATYRSLLNTRYFMNSEYYHFTNRDVSRNEVFRPKYQYICLNGGFIDLTHSEMIGFKSFLHLKAEEEFSPTFEVSLSDLVVDRGDNVVFMMGTSFNFCDMELVISVENPTGEIFWRSRKLSQQLTMYDSTGKVNLFYTVESLGNSSIDYKKGKLKAYIWNKNHCNAIVSPFQIGIFDGNPYISSYSQ